MDEAVIAQMEASGNPEMIEMAQQWREGQKAKFELIEKAISERDWDKALVLVASEARAEMLVRILDTEEVGKAEANELLRDWFNLCDALGPYTEALRPHFERAGYVTDEPGKVIELPVTIYRAQWGKDPVPTGALSWTLEREKAEWFAKYLTGPRGWFLGIKRDDDEPWIWQATATELYGYLNGREEQEVIPKTLRDLVPIAKLVSVPPE